jgi:arsenite-transporting ATPase
MHRRGDELVVKVGQYKRTLILPQTLQRLEIREASFVGDTLEVRFAREPGVGPAPRARSAEGGRT